MTILEPTLFAFLLNDTFLNLCKFFYNSLLIVSTLTIGSSLALCFVATFYNNDDDFEDEPELSLYDKTCYYEIKYLEEFRKLQERELSKDNIKDLITKNVEDETPMGKIIMTYNHETESFWYYCDTKTLTYKTLDAVARLFAIKYDCKQICVDYQKEWEEGRQAVLNQRELENSLDDEEEEEEKQKKEDSVFAQFKSYNINSNRTKTKNTSTNSKPYIHTDKSNRFSYKGRISDYIDPSCIPDEKPNDKTNLLFADFKNSKHFTNQINDDCCNT